MSRGLSCLLLGGNLRHHTGSVRKHLELLLAALPTRVGLRMVGDLSPLPSSTEALEVRLSVA